RHSPYSTFENRPDAFGLTSGWKKKQLRQLAFIEASISKEGRCWSGVGNATAGPPLQRLSGAPSVAGPWRSPELNGGAIHHATSSRFATRSAIQASTSERTNAKRLTPSGTALGKRPSSRSLLIQVRDMPVMAHTSVMFMSLGFSIASPLLKMTQ